MARHQLAVAAFLASVVLLLSQEATAVVVGTLNLQREALAPYVSSGLQANLGDAIKLNCPNLNGTHPLYHLFEDQFTNCTQPEPRNYKIGDCTSGKQLILLLSDLSLSIVNLPRYRDGGTFYYGLYSSSLSNEQCVSGIKFSVTIPDLKSPSTPSPTVSQTVQQTTTVASSTPSPSSQPVATTDRRVTSPTTQTDNSGRPAQTPTITERPSVGGIANSSSLLRLSTALTVILVLVAALIL